MLRQTLEMNIKRIVDFLIYSRNFLIRKNPLKSLSESIVEGFSDNEKEVKNGAIQVELPPSSTSENGTVNCRK